MLKVRDQSSEDFRVVIDVAKRRIATVANPSTEFAGPMAMVEHDATVSAVASFAHFALVRSWAASFALHLLQPFSVETREIGGAVLRPPPLHCLRFLFAPLVGVRQFGFVYFAASGVDLIATLVVQLANMLAGFRSFLFGENFFSVQSVIGSSSCGIRHDRHLAWESGVA